MDGRLLIGGLAGFVAGLILLMIGQARRVAADTPADLPLGWLIKAGLVVLVVGVCLFGYFLVGLMLTDPVVPV